MENISYKRVGYKRIWRLTVLATGFAVLAGCASIPDAVNPVEWYKGTVDFFTGDEAPLDGEGQAAAVPGAEKQFPNLSAVPDQPPVAQGLAGDTASQYASGGVQRQGLPSNVLRGDPQPAPLPAQVIVPAPAPAPVAAAPAPSPPPPAEYTPPPQVAFNPPAPAPIAPPTGDVSVERTFRASLAQQRPGDGPSTLGALAPAGLPAPGSAPFQMVVVSSAGVELVGQEAPPAVTTSVVQSSSPQVSQLPPAAPLPRVSPLPGNAVRVATILFPVGSASLGSRDKDILRKVSALHRQNGGNVRIVGHASSRTKNMDLIEHKMTNFKISVNRANVIARELVRLGVGKDQIIVGARSDEEPVYYEIMPSGEAGNRRAEVYLEY